MIVAVVVIIGGLAGLKIRQIRAGMAKGAKFAPPPAAVTTVVVKAQTWQPVLSAVGSLRAVNGVMVSTDLAGIVAEIAFESGSVVKKGTLLLRMNTQQETAQLQSSEARLVLAKTDLQRKRDLIAKKAIAASELDTAESQLRQMEASVSEMRALVSRKQIEAPFDGMLGIRQVDVGQYLNPGATVVSLQSVDPIYVEFSLPQQNLGSLKTGKPLRLRTSGTGEEMFEGEVTAINSQVDASTRNVMVQGTVKNPDHKLRAGMFVEVELLLPEQDGVLAIPATSIAYAPYGDSIYIVRPSPDGKGPAIAQQQFVKLGARRGDVVTVVSGVKEGEEVVTSGTFKLAPNAPIQVNNDVQPGNELNPVPPNT